jgi:hypothetical protein
VKRDTQRSRVYSWENHARAHLAHESMWDPDFKTLDECADFANPIWRKERARYGHAGKDAPMIVRPNRGQRRALAYTHSGPSRISLPRWARSRWVVLHEMAHHLAHGDGHGPRFVAVLIGLAARWLEYDAGQLMALADEMDVKYNATSVGAVPQHGPVWHVERAVRMHGPMTRMDLACHLSLYEGVEVTPKAVQGAALYLAKHGRARWLRHKLVLLGDALPPPEPVKPKRKASKPGPESTKGQAEKYEIKLDRTRGGGWMVYPPAMCYPNDDDDPYYGDHFAEDWAEVARRVDTYATDAQALMEKHNLPVE